jgi:hypothetical protein
MEKSLIIAIVSAVVIAILYFYFMKKKAPVEKKAEQPPAQIFEPVKAKFEPPSIPEVVSNAVKGIIYGSMGCPHTVTQIKKHPGFEFVDCGVQGRCPSFVTAYPTTKHPDGTIEIGCSN